MKTLFSVLFLFSFLFIDGLSNSNNEEEKKNKSSLEHNFLTPYSSYFEKIKGSPPLALHRLFPKLKDIFERIMTTLGDEQMFRIHSGKDGSLSREILRLFLPLQSDFFALTSAVESTRLFETFKNIRGHGGGLETFDKIAVHYGKIQMLSTVFDGFLSQSQDDSTIIEADFILDFTSSILFTSPLSRALDDLHGYTFEIFVALSTLSNDSRCSLHQSPHSLLYNLYNLIALTDIKGYALIQFSYMMLKVYGKGNFTVESNLAKVHFERNVLGKYRALQETLPKVSRDYWKCDASLAVEGRTYIRLTNLLQGFIENEADMNPRASCKESCDSYTVTSNYGCYKDLFCAKQAKCEGRLFDCRFIHADATVCMSRDKGRRYDWIEYEDNTLLGVKTTCDNPIKVDSWWRWIFWHCSYCLCKCDAPGRESDRYWSLKPSLSSANENYVIIGLRFKKRNRVICIDIEEGKALPEGGIDEQSRRWVECESIDLNKGFKEGNFMEMSYEERSFDLDTLEAHKGHVVTGLRFRNLGGHINLEIQVTPISFSSGILEPKLATWIGNDNTPATEIPRTQLELSHPALPTSSMHSEIDSQHNQYVVFDTTSADKDAMQTTVPYIDAQPLTLSTGTWITGIGLHHKGQIGYGGYIGLSLSTFDFSTQLLPEISVDDMNNNNNNKDKYKIVK